MLPLSDLHCLLWRVPVTEDLGPAPLDDLQENTKPHSMMKLDLKIILHISGAGS